MTLREQIRKGLGTYHTKELEDSLYIHLSEFLDVCRVNIRSNLLEKLETSLRDLLQEIENEKE